MECLTMQKDNAITANIIFRKNHRKGGVKVKMKITWKTVTGSQLSRPEVLDKTSSSRYVYLRRNIKQITRTDDKSAPVVLWEYEEAKVTQEEFAQYDNIIMDVLQAELNNLAFDQAALQETLNEAVQINQANQANIEYIAMMSDVDLEG